MCICLVNQFIIRNIFIIQKFSLPQHYYHTKNVNINIFIVNVNYKPLVIIENVITAVNPPTAEQSSSHLECAPRRSARPAISSGQLLFETANLSTSNGGLQFKYSAIVST